MQVEVGGKIVNLPDNYDPRNTNEEYMCERHRAFFKKMLTDWLNDVRAELSANIDGEDMDRRSIDESDSISSEVQTLQELRKKDRLRKLALKIEENINKIDQDTYGFCEEIGNEIGINRLMIRPIARYCIEIQEKKEQEEEEMEYLEYNQDIDTIKDNSDNDAFNSDDD